MEQYIGEISILGFSFSPVDMARCDGRLMSPSQNAALYSLLGTTFGGDGRSSFQLPNLIDKVPIGHGTSDAGTSYTQGDQGGANLVSLTPDEAEHLHIMQGSSKVGDTGLPVKSPDQSNIPATVNPSSTAPNMYNTGSNLTPIGQGGVQYVGASEAHENRQPYLALNFVIALSGIYPPRS